MAATTASSTTTAQPSSAGRAFEQAIARERLDSTRRLNRYRCYALSVFLALVIVFRLTSPDWIGPLGKLAVSWSISIVVLLIGTLSDRAARATALAVPLVDPPLLLWIMADNATSLAAAGYPIPAQAIRLGAAVFFLLIVLLSSLSLDVRLVYLTGAVAAACQVALMLLGTPDVTWVVFVPVTYAVAAVVLGYSIERTRRLVRTVATEELRRAHLARYFPPQVAERMDVESDTLRAGESHEVTLLFCDIRDFTRLARTLDSRSVVATLNDFHSGMVDAIFEHGGTLDKFMGDGLMAYFGAPIPQPDHAARAVRCAVRMQRTLAEVNARRSAVGAEILRMGIGIHSGSVVLGDVGAPGRRDYTAIGDAVNVASRLEQATKDQEASILISDVTRQLAGDAVRLRRAAPAPIRGGSASMPCWTPVDVAEQPAASIAGRRPPA